MTPAFVDELLWRGLLYFMTPDLPERLAKGPIKGYIGFDPTAASLHIGNLATGMLLVHLQRHGHSPIALVGGATGMIGDPSGKSEERKLLDEEQLRHNQAGIQAQLAQWLDFSPTLPNKAQLVNNYDWMKDYTFLCFLRDVGKHLTVNYMMAKDSVKQRLETGLSFTEFSYQLLQAYDFYYLHTHHKCELQMGGSDQWGNITSGTELIRRMGGAEAYALTCPLVTKADGSKFGKSERGNVWLDPQLTSPYKFYQFWLNVADEDVAKMLKVFSLQQQEVIEDLITQSLQQPEQRTAQKTLAEEMTVRIHGQAALQQASAATQALFGNAPIAALAAMSEAQLLDVLESVPSGQVARSSIEPGAGVLDVLVACGAFASKGEARKMIQGGGVRINKEKVSAPEATLQAEQLIHGKYLLIQKGKKNYHLAVFG